MLITKFYTQLTEKVRTRKHFKTNHKIQFERMILGFKNFKIKIHCLNFGSATDQKF